MGRKKHPEPLTPAEQRVLDEVRTGATNAEIAVRLGLSINTVKYHVANMLAKTGLTDRSELRNWTMPREGGANWWLRGAVALSGLVGVVALLSVVLLTSGGETEREAWIAYPSTLSTLNDRLVLVEARTGTEREILGGRGWQFEAPRWSPDGRWIAIGTVHSDNADQTELRIYERESLALHSTIAGVTEANWAPDSTRLVATGRTTALMAEPNGSVLDSRPVPFGGGPTMRWAPDSSAVTSGDESGIEIWDRDGGLRQLDPRSFSWPVPPRSLSAFGFTESGLLVVATTPDGWFTVDLATGEVAQTSMGAVGFIDSERFPELAELSAKYPPGQLRPLGMSVDGRGRAYWITGDHPPEELSVMVVAGDGQFDEPLAGFEASDVSIVLVGDWTPAPVLPAPQTTNALP